jgi:epoxide hydrolase-like predicted phosphatase
VIKAIIFDFFSVLAIRDSLPFRKAYFSDDAVKSQQDRSALNQLGRGEIGYNDYIDKLAELGGVSREQVLVYTEDYHANQDLLEYIKTELKPNYKIGIISNAGDDRVLRILGEASKHLFDDIVLSYKTGIIKPDPRIYEMSAKNLGLKPLECVFVDDILSYCQGAESIGMNSIWYRDFPQMKNELEKLLAAGSNN